MTIGAARASGFTLLETIVALAILGMLMLGLSRGVGFGLDAWRRQSADDDRRSGLEPADRLLRALVAEMEPQDSFASGQPIDGDAHKMAFRTRLPTEAVPVGERAAEVAIGVDGRHRLMLRSWPLYRALDGAPPVSETELARDVARLDIAFWDPRAGAWQSQWTSADLPGLVRVHVTFRDPTLRWPDIVAAPRRQQVRA